jgi:hypothetical protein
MCASIDSYNPEALPSCNTSPEECDGRLNALKRLLNCWVGLLCNARSANGMPIHSLLVAMCSGNPVSKPSECLTLVQLRSRCLRIIGEFFRIRHTAIMSNSEGCRMTAMLLRGMQQNSVHFSHDRIAMMGPKDGSTVFHFAEMSFEFLKSRD